MAELGGIISVSDDFPASHFQKDLESLRKKYAEIIGELPCDLPGSPYDQSISLTQRSKWLEVQVIRPIDKLKAALENENVPMFSTWPYPISEIEFPDREGLRSELAKLLDYSKILHRDLQGQQKGNEGHNQEIRQEIFSDIVLLMREHLPDLEISRGVYDSESREYVGQYVEALRYIFHKISGVHDQLDRLIKEEIRNPSQP